MFPAVQAHEVLDHLKELPLESLTVDQKIQVTSPSLLSVIQVTSPHWTISTHLIQVTSPHWTISTHLIQVNTGLSILTSGCLDVPVQVFTTQLMASPVQVSASGFCVVNKVTLVSVVMGVTMYFIILVQFSEDLKSYTEKFINMTTWDHPNC
uniref:Uncharacterized protein n=1 Tax=Timema bartmani TaxID=61472 RepID=A0A7R9FDF3_9NEOP|nr:unnamed protein product [Timema bartmani]